MFPLCQLRLDVLKLSTDSIIFHELEHPQPYDSDDGFENCRRTQQLGRLKAKARVGKEEEETCRGRCCSYLLRKFQTLRRSRVSAGHVKFVSKSFHALHPTPLHVSALVGAFGYIFCDWSFSWGYCRDPISNRATVPRFGRFYEQH